MDTQLPDVVEIPSGAVKVRTICGVPMEAGILLGLLGVVPILMFRSWWLVLVLPPLWAWLKWHGIKDPLFLRTWSSQITFADYYHA